MSNEQFNLQLQELKLQSSLIYQKKYLSQLYLQRLHQICNFILELIRFEYRKYFEKKLLRVNPKDFNHQLIRHST